jgi:hypothetical protein
MHGARRILVDPTRTTDIGAATTTTIDLGANGIALAATWSPGEGRGGS